MVELNLTIAIATDTYLWASTRLAAMVSLAPTVHRFHVPWVTEAPQRRRTDVARFAQRQHTWR